MQNIIEWLAGIEDRTAKLYGQAAIVLGHDAWFSKFLLNLANEEKTHVETMKKAAKLTNGHSEAWSTVTIEAGTRVKIETLFAKCEKMMASGGCSVEKIANFIAEAETSEWNDAFLFVINTLKRAHREFIPATAGMQQHRRGIERFFETRKNLKPHLDRMRKLQPLWRESFLVVDDEPIIADVLSAILENEGNVETAGNGAEGLAKLEAKYYSVIITDVDMPVMGGIEFYEKAVLIHPGCKSRFLFFTGLMDEARIDLFVKHRFRYLKKPANIHEIRKAVIEILGA